MPVGAVGVPLVFSTPVEGTMHPARKHWCLHKAVSGFRHSDINQNNGIDFSCLNSSLKFLKVWGLCKVPGSRGSRKHKVSPGLRLKAQDSVYCNKALPI